MGGFLKYPFVVIEVVLKCGQEDGKMMETTNNQPARTTQDAGELLTRIDAILDELYALREAVREWTKNHSDERQIDSLRETSLTVSPIFAQVVKVAPATQRFRESVVADDPVEAAQLVTATLPETSLIRQLAGSLGPGSPDEIYTNAEIDEMRFGDEWL